MSVARRIEVREPRRPDADGPRSWDDAGRRATDELAHALGRSGTSPPLMDPTVRVGVDLADVEEVARSIEQFGDRYVHRVFTPHEIACCRTEVGRSTGAAGGSPPSGTVLGYSAESLAARFAAKEATIKVLRPGGVRPDWRSIEVHRLTGGWCELRLSGLAAALADEGGIVQLAVSMTHEGTMAAAVVVAACEPGGSRGDQRTGAQNSPPSMTGEE